MIFVWHYLAGFAAAFLFAVLLTRCLRARGSAWGFVDRPAGPRRLHGRPMPLVGGMAIVLSMFLALAMLAVVSPVGGLLQQAENRLFLPLVAGALAMHLFGVLDDRKEFSPQVKLLGQIAIATAVFLGGVRLASLHVPGMGMIELSFWPCLLVTVFWLVAITNAFNLVDGTDGLAAGTALLATLAMLVASLVFGNGLTSLLLAVTAGALLGFLYFNFPPASVFLGDGGSLFLGFLLAGLGVVSSAKSATALAIVIPLVAFGLPVLDTVLVVFRRALRGVPIAGADRRHIHHRLLELGHTPRQVVLILYSVGGLFAIASLVVLSGNGPLIGLVFLVLGAGLYFGVRRLRLPELRALGLGVVLQRDGVSPRRTMSGVEPAVRIIRRFVVPVDRGPDAEAGERDRVRRHGSRRGGASDALSPAGELLHET